MRIFISADIEGIAGVVSREHQFPEGLEWQSARVWMTDSVAAAAEAAFEAGATEVVVADSHGQGHNLLLDRLAARDPGGPLAPAPALDDAGRRSGRLRGLLLHRLSRRRDQSGRYPGPYLPLGDAARVNGVSVPEATIDAAIAGHHGVPVLLVTGDDVCIAETRAI